MLLDADRLKGMTIEANDGDMGVLDDLFFDDECWCVQYLIVDTKLWWPGGQVLVPPAAFKEVDWSEPGLRVDLTKQAVKDCPDVSTDLPLTREQERDYRGYFGWPVYWGGANDFGSAMYPGAGTVSRPITPVRPEPPTKEVRASTEDESVGHLFSMNDFKGFDVKCENEQVGTVAGVIVDTEQLNLKYVIVDTGSIFSGKRVLVSVGWLRLPSWDDELISADVDPEKLESAPGYEKETEVNREYEEKLFSHFGKTPYWQ